MDGSSGAETDISADVALEVLDGQSAHLSISASRVVMTTTV